MVHETSTPQERRRQAKLDALLDAALVLVAEGGLDQLTVGRLASRMQWTKGAMYRYFRSKDQLIAALNARVLGAWTTVAEAAVVGIEPPVERLRVLIDTLIALSIAQPQAFGLVSLTLAEPRDLVADIDDAVHVPAMMGLLGQVAACIDAAQGTGVFTAGEPLQRALRLVFAVIGVLQLRKLARFDPTTFDAEHLARQILDDLLAAWST